MLTEENSLPLAHLALSAFGYDPATVPLTFVKLRENCVFRADTPDGPIALRLHRPGYRSPAEISAESEYIEFLAERGFPVVQLVPAPSGGHIVSVRDGDHEVVVDAQRWVEGSRPLGSSHDSEGSGENVGLHADHFEAMGTLAARLHHVAEESAATHTFTRAPWSAEGVIGERALWGDALSLPSLTPKDADLLRRTRQSILAELERFGTSPAVYGTIHADFTPENLLLADGEFVLIDFDDFGEGWYLFDLATALFFLQGHPEYEQFHGALLRGYGAVRPLSTRELDLLDLFLVARGFTYLGWAATRGGAEAGPSAQETAQFVVDEIVPLVVRLAEDLEARQTAS